MWKLIVSSQQTGNCNQTKNSFEIEKSFKITFGNWAFGLSFWDFFHLQKIDNHIIIILKTMTRCLLNIFIAIVALCDFRNVGIVSHCCTHDVWIKTLFSSLLCLNEFLPAAWGVTRLVLLNTWTEESRWSIKLLLTWLLLLIIFPC